MRRRKLINGRVAVIVLVPKGTTQFVCTWHPGMVIDVVGS
jgi:hypothetical protein